MSHHPRKLIRRKNSIQFFDSIKPPSNDEADKELSLFHEDNHYKPEYLEMPIKIQGDLAQPRLRHDRLHESSNESSEHHENQDMFSETPEKSHIHSLFKDNGKDEYEDLMNPLNKIDAIDSLLLSFYDNYPQNPNQINQYLLLDPLQIKEEASPSDYRRFSHLKQDDTLHLESLQDKQKSLLTLINHFRSFNHATTVSMNYHKLAKKDVLTKDHTSVFNLLTKQIRKLQQALENEQVRFVSMLQDEKKRVSHQHKKNTFGIPKELASTHGGCLPEPNEEHLLNEVKSEEEESPRNAQ